mgnify:CR=1 FL=1
MRQIGSGITGSQLADNVASSEIGWPHGETGAATRSRDPAISRNAGIVTRCLQRLNASRRKATEADWTAAEMRRPTFLRPIWALDGDRSAVRQALSLTCTQSEAADLVKVLRGLTGISAEQRDRAGIMVPAFVSKLTDYPPLIASEVVHDWCETEEFFPRSWSLLKDRLDMVRGSLEALAK